MHWFKGMDLPRGMWQVETEAITKFQNYIVFNNTRVAPDTLPAEIRKHSTPVLVDDTEQPSYMYVNELVPPWKYKDVYKLAEDLLRRANSVSWKFHLTHWGQPIRMNTYPCGIGFSDHTDHNHRDDSKLVFVQVMNDEYEGGDLYIDNELVKLSKGDIVVFPSFMQHRVDPITSGTRITLSGWAAGPRFY